MTTRRVTGCISRRTLLAGSIAGGAVALGSIGGARAQSAYPTRPIRLIVPYAAGGGVDILARQLGEQLRPLLGQTFIIDNRPGASGMIGAQAAATAAPDGYTLLVCAAGEIVINPHLYRKMEYDAFRDLQPIMLVVTVPNVLVVHPDVPARNAAELLALARAQPGKLTYGSSGTGNQQHLSGELLARMAKVELVHVPYKGSAPQMADLAAGQITMGFTALASSQSLIKAGKLRVLAVTSKQRLPALPDVPALAETPGLESYELNNWFGLLAPAAVPAPIIQTLHGAMTTAMAKPELVATLVEQGGIPSAGTPEAFRAFMAAESAAYAALVKEIGVKADG